MTYVLLVCVLVSIAVGAWSTHRHIQMLAWNRELEAAFSSRDRGDAPPPGPLTPSRRARARRRRSLTACCRAGR